MTKELKAVKKLLQEWRVFLEVSRKKGNTHFPDLSDYSRLHSLFSHLAISSSMSVQELETALQILENIAVKKVNTNRPIPFHQSLKERKERSYNKHYGVATSFTPVAMVVDDGSNLHKFLIKNHQMLLNFYERSHLHTLGETPFSEVNYSAAQLKESQAFLDMQETSKVEKNTDQSTILPDLNRGGVTFNHTKVKLKNPDNTSDPRNFQVIEDFTRDRVDFPLSRANKILNFGGQFIDGIVLEEFTNSTAFADSHVTGIQPGYVLGNIDWSKDDKGIFHATVNLKVLTVTLPAPDTSSELPNIYAMGSDGSSLIEIDPDLAEAENVQLRCRKEKNGDTEGNVTPICEINAKVKLTNANEFSRYELQIEEFKVQYNTSDLISIKSPDNKPPSNLSL